MKIYTVLINRKTRATEAKRKGLEPLAKWLLQKNLDKNVDEKAQEFINEEVSTVEDAIKGHRILLLNKFQMTLNIVQDF